MYVPAAKRNDNSSPRAKMATLTHGDEVTSEVGNSNTHT
jgi:hypothetical protein